MRTLTEQLTNYAAYHRDRRNVATHFVGIPMIVVGLFGALARPSPLVALAAALGAAVFYIALDRRFGAAMLAVLAASVWAGLAIAAQPFAAWLALSAGLFVAGWVIQFVGHVFEGRKPAFVDDLVGLLVGPLFIVAEAAFALGLRADLKRDIEAKAGPMRPAAPLAVKPQ